MLCLLYFDYHIICPFMVENAQLSLLVAMLCSQFSLSFTWICHTLSRGFFENSLCSNKVCMHYILVRPHLYFARYVIVDKLFIISYIILE